MLYKEVKGPLHTASHPRQWKNNLTEALGKYKVQDQVLNEGFPHLPYLMRYFRAQCKRFADRLPHRV